MCRFLVYKGREMLMADLLTSSEQSLIRQSFQARERAEPLNGDGFGVGWYVPEIDSTPCVFTSTTPAWSNRNLHRLAEKIRSTSFFAHVRAASPGLPVADANCHPFQFEEFLWMHNGAIGEFSKIKRRLRETLSDEYYDLIQGTTDSEHAFAVFLGELAPRLRDYSVSDLRDAVVATIRRLDAWTAEAGVVTPSRCNFALTDGRNVVATRYATSPEVPCETLYYSSGDKFENVAGRFRMRAAQRRVGAVIVASEPLTEERSDWTSIPENHLVMVTPELHVKVEPIDPL
ncbi:MAG: class II glutamine amidotransferase [Rhodospirillales bacterium]|nr:class II glutamine amidotransferase [Rhodospirillales bacterium]